MSNPPAAEAVEMAIRLQAYEFLFKPFTAADVLAIIKTYARISSPTKVLVVDDSATVRQIVHRIVSGSVFNCEITEASDGEMALALCHWFQFDVVFLDCNMPGLSGLATMKQLGLLQPSLKIVMISADRDAGNEAEELGTCTFLQKPFNSEDVDRILHAAFGLRSPNLKMKITQQNFDVAIEGSTIRLAHKIGGHIFEYLWCERPPYLRNGVIHPAHRCGIAPNHVAPVAEKIAMLQLRTANLLVA